MSSWLESYDPEENDYDDYFTPEYIMHDDTTVRAGDKVYAHGIGDKVLGVGRFFGTLSLREASGDISRMPVVEVQGELVSGGQVDLWTTDPKIIAANRNAKTYPIGDYLAEIHEWERQYRAMVGAAIAEQLGVRLDV